MNPASSEQLFSLRKTYFYVLIGIVVFLTLLSYTSTVYLYRDLIFDDSFITYRYAKNLIGGFGITWNRGEAPTEGFTSFLHVILMAPVIGMKIDPLWVTRILSLMCIAGITVSLYHLAQKLLNITTLHAVLIASPFPAMSFAGVASMLGLETLIFTLLAFLSFHFAVLYLLNERQRDIRISFILQFLALLARPEQALLTVCIIIGLMLSRHGKLTASTRVIIKNSAIFFVMPVIIYLTWKWFHFHSLLPNSFHIKYSSDSLLSSGFSHEVDFLKYQWLLVSLALLSSLSFTKGLEQWHRRIALAFCGGFLLFYLHANTLMNNGMRFFIPLTPFFYCLSLPLLSKALLWIGRFSAKSSLKAAFAAVAFLLIVFNHPLGYVRNIQGAINGDRIEYPLMLAEYKIGKALSSYPHIKEIRIAFADAGVIPYLSDSLFLDVVGLNDSFIARERDLYKLVSYFFSQRPTLALIPIDKEFLDPITYGHGPMGNYQRWMLHPGWKGFSYAGTAETGSYTLMFLVNKDSPHAQSLTEFLGLNVVTGMPTISYLPSGL